MQRVCDGDIGCGDRRSRSEMHSQALATHVCSSARLPDPLRASLIRNVEVCAAKHGTWRQAASFGPNDSVRSATARLADPACAIGPKPLRVEPDRVLIERLFRHFNREDAACSGYVSHAQRSAVRRDAAARYGKPEAKAAAILTGLGERPEHRLGSPMWQSPAMIRDFDPHPLAVGTHMKTYQGARMGELESVLEKIIECAKKAAAVTRNRERWCTRRHRESGELISVR